MGTRVPHEETRIMRQTLWSRTLLLATLVLALLGPARAQQDVDLGLGKMWPFESIPADYFQKNHGFVPTQEWLDAVRLASIRFGSGCSSSFVSPKGLVMTNHHCVRDFIAKACPPDQDWVKNGFVAKRMADEVPLEGLTVQQLVAMQDITEAMNAGIRPGDSVDAIAAKRQANEEQILEKAGKEHPDLTARTVKLYQGGKFELYLYKVFTDLRLVCSPHLQTSHFGGDPDNFTYPRFGIDFSFCRAYEDGKPVDSSAYYFKFDPEGAEEGESVFVTGNPGRTERLLTYAQLEYKRDVELPMILDIIDSRLASMRARAKASPQAEKDLRPGILGLENAQKAYRGYWAGVKDTGLMAKKKTAEAELRRRVNADPKLASLYGDAWDELAKVAARKRTLTPSLRYHRTLGIPLVSRAMAVLDAVNDKLSEEARSEALSKATTGDPRLDGGRLDAVAANLAVAHRWLGGDDGYIRALFGNAKEPKAALLRLQETSRLTDAEFVKGLIQKGARAVAASDDAALVAAKALRAAIDRNKQLQPEVAAAEDVHKTRIGQAVFALFGTSVSPDATGTLRLSDGKVQGFPYNGTIAPWFTTFYGLYGRNIAFGNEHPFDLPEPWLAKKDKIDLSRPVDFVATNDIIGGNSGSPVIDKDRHVVGLVFDGNIEMLANNFFYRGDIPRSVNVHPAAIMEALTKIYGAWRLVAELMGQD